MHKPFFHLSHTTAITLVAMFLVCLVPLTSVHAAGRFTGPSDPADSLARMAAGYYAAEPTVQSILTTIDPTSAAAGALSREVFCTAQGGITAGMVGGSSSLTSQISLLWYTKGLPETAIMVLPAHSAHGDSAVFFLPDAASIGWCIKTPSGTMWYSEPELNADGTAHVQVYPAREPGTYVLCWEDLSLSGDRDFNDLIVRVRFPHTSPSIALTAEGLIDEAPDAVGLTVTAATAACTNAPVTVRMVEGPGTFEPVTDFGTVHTTHRFVPERNGLYTFVFEASAEGAVPVTDTLVIPVATSASATSNLKININSDNYFTICHPETLTVPFSITSTCRVTEVYTEPPAILDIADSTVGYFAGVPFESCFYLVARDACGGKDSVYVCFIIEANEPTVVTYPSRIDTTLCTTGWVCYPLTMSGGQPPIQATAIPPAYYNSAMQQVCYPVSKSGVYDSKIVVTNAACPPDTHVTKIHAFVNTPPRFEGIPNTTVAVCGLAPYCFGPITCADDEDNVVSCVQTKGPGTFNGTTWCYTPTGTQTVSAIFRVADGCNRIAYDTLRVSFTASSLPVITFNSITKNLCAPQTVCVPYSVSGGSAVMSLIGQGTLDVANSRVCLPISASGDYPLTLVATPACGPPDTVTATIHATMNQPPSVICSAPDVDTVAPGTEVCVSYTVSDPNGEALNITIQGPGFTVPRQSASGTSDDICFSVIQQGIQSVRIIVSDACGRADTCTATFPVWFNAGPSVTAPDTNVFLCSAVPICIPVTCSDPDNNLAICDAQGSRPGTFNGSEFCFIPDTAGTYTIDAYAEDVYGSSATHTSIVRVSYDAPPVVHIVGDNNVTVTAGETVCFSYTATDPDGNLDTVTPSGPAASFNASQICVTGVYSEVVCAWVVATDECGHKDSARVCVTSTPGQGPHPNLPDTVEVRLCAGGDICVPLTVGTSECPPMTLTGLGGATIEYGDTDTSLCLSVSQPGIYHAGVTAIDLCGEETAEVVLVVSDNNPPVINCPQPNPFFTCNGQPMCTSIAYADPEGNVMEVTASAGAMEQVAEGLLELCFDVDTSGWYTAQIIVSDSCGAADTCNFARQVTRNSPPQIVSPGDTTVLLCEVTDVCLPVSCYDADGNSTICVATSLGDAEWDGTDLCFTPPVSGLYEWVFFTQDNCGEYVSDTVRANVHINRRPTITAPPAIYAPMCEAESVLVAYEVSDPDGGQLVTFIDGCEDCTGDIKVFSETAGTICYDLIVRDECLAADTTQVCVTFDLNQPPVVTAPDDFSTVLCDYEHVCFDVTIEDDFSPWTASVTPLGTYDPAEGTVCFPADTAGTYQLVITATDSCGATGSDTVGVTVSFNSGPVVTAVSRPATICAPGQQVCVGGIRVYDANANTRRFYCASEDAVFDSSAGTLCFDAPTAGLYCFDIAAEDSCGESDLKTICINVGVNAAPSVTISGLGGTPVFFEPTEMCFSINASDPNTNQLFDLDMIEGGGTFARRFDHAPISAQHCFLADTTGCYRFIFEATDSCGLAMRDTATICIRVEDPDTMFQVCIDTVESLNGRNVTVKVRGIQMMEAGGYDFLICYDPTMLYFLRASTDSALTKWEYFTYRIGTAAGCLPCGASVVRLIGIADMNNGSPHPPDWAFTPKGPLHALTFFVTSDRNYLNMCAPIRFCTFDCADNTISSKSGDSLFVRLEGIDEACFEDGKYPPVPLIDFCDGLICIVPPEDDRGDINLNGIVNEVADAVLFSNWFIYGDAVWDPLWKENQILATDVNCDGLVLTLSDLVQLIRYITGDDQPQGCADGPGKVAAQPSHAARISAERTSDGLEFWVESGIDLGGVYVRLSAPSGAFGMPQWDDDLGGLTPKYNRTGSEMRFLLLSMQSGTALPSGRRHLFTVPWDGSGKWTIEDAQSAGAEAELVTTEFGAGADPLPKSYSLEQNYPNPFNANTQIRFSLGAAATWEISIYNVLGQVVRRFEGTSEAGEVLIEWDAKASDGVDLASGVYFTRLKVDKFTATRKMVLLK